MKIKQIFKDVRASGGRITKIKREIIRFLLQRNCLVSGADILADLQEKKIRPDRSTLYRELIFLTKNNIVKKNIIKGFPYFEIPRDHHHHLVCLKCSNIKKISMRDHLVEHEKQIARENRFEIVNHSLEFYGYCRNCQA